MLTAVKPMKLGEILDRSLKLIGKTFWRSTIIGAILIVPATLLVALGIQSMLSLIQDAAIGAHDWTNKDAERFLWLLVARMPLVFVGGLLLSIGTVAANQAITLLACSEFGGEPITWGEAMRTAIGMRTVKAIGQSFLMVLAMWALMAIPYGLMVGGIISRSTAFTIIGSLAMLPGIGYMIYLLMRWSFAGTVIAYENAGVIDSFRRSSFLVDGQWWRVVGITMLLSIIASFAISLVTLPLQVLGMWGFIVKMIDLSEHARQSGYKPNPSEIFSLFASIGPAIAVVVAAQQILSLAIKPAYLSVMYFDLRARKNEFPEFGEQVQVSE